MPVDSVEPALMPDDSMEPEPGAAEGFGGSLPLYREDYRTLLESTRVIPWQLDWTTQRYAYLGPQIQRLLGWPLHSWQCFGDLTARIHAEDRDFVVQFCTAQALAGEDHEVDYRLLTASGQPVWIRQVVHVVQDVQGNLVSLMGFMFDISERKSAEEALKLANQRLMALSYEDELTGLANRRRFFEVYRQVWAQAQRKQQVLSLILLDVDFFKQYNDHHGHVQGDQCLRQVAQIIQSCAQRPLDMAARYGGEEFVLLLPQVGPEGAQAVAAEVRARLAQAAIPHGAPGSQGILTISQGIGSKRPTLTDCADRFLTQVDDQLYAAKDRGRNCWQVQEF